MSDEILKWTPAVDKFVQQYGRRMAPDKQEDLRQDILVALLEYDKPLNSDRVLQIAMQTVDDSHAAKAFEQKFVDLGIPSPLNLDVQLEVREALATLPENLQAVANDLFFEGLDQEEVAWKHDKSQGWVSKARKQILTLLRTQLKRSDECQ